MDTAVMILIALFLMMLVLMVSILLHKQPEPAGSTDTLTMSASAKEEKKKMSTIEDLFFDLEEEEDDGLPQEEFQEFEFSDDLKQAESQLDQGNPDPADHFEIKDSEENPEPGFDEEMLHELFADADPEFAPFSDETGSEEPSFDENDDLFIHRPTLEEDQKADENVNILRQALRIAWPESDVMMVSVAFGSSVLFIWEGLAATNDLIMCDVREKGMAYPLLEEVRKISARNLKPANKFAILVHTEEKADPSCSQMAAAFLRANRSTPAVVISDFGGEYQTEGILSEYELITVGTRPFMTVSTEAPYESVNKIIAASARNVRTEEVNDTALEALNRMKDRMPISVRAKLAAGFASRSAARKAADKYHEISGWIGASFRSVKNGDGAIIRIEAPDEIMLEEAMNSFRENMRKNGYAFRILEQLKDCVPASVYDDAFIRLSKAMKAAGIEKTAIPVLTSKDYSVKGIRSLSFAAERMEPAVLRRLLENLIMNS